MRHLMDQVCDLDVLDRHLFQLSPRSIAFNGRLFPFSYRSPVKSIITFSHYQIITLFPATLSQNASGK